MSRLCSSRFERAARKLGWMRIAGIDEAGRGALFGPVVAAAVILNPRRRIVGLDDSKKLTPERRACAAHSRTRSRLGGLRSGRPAHRRMEHLSGLASGDDRRASATDDSARLLAH